MTCSQLEVTSDCVCTQPKREHLVHEFDGDYHRVRDVVTGVATSWAPSSQLVYFCGYVGVCSGQTLPLGIYAIVIEPENAFAFDPLLQIKKQERQVEADEVEWVVNNYFEVGVKIRGRSFFLYKGRSLEYTEEKITTRPLGKRELGEVLRVNGEDQ